MDLFVTLGSQAVLLVVMGLDYENQKRRLGDRAQEQDPFLLWVLRVYFFSVMAIPFYLFRTRGKLRWGAVGLGVAALWMLLTSLVATALGGCSASRPEPRADARVDSRRHGATRSTVAPAALPAANGPDASVPSLDVDRTVAKLRSRNFHDVLAAKDLLVEQGGPEAISALVTMSTETARVPLENTDDLIYPGARQFHGHGLVLPYDVDRLGARAGWVLEELTVRDFGFSRAPFWLATEPLEDPNASVKAANWWRAQQGRFSRVAAIAAALRDPRGTRSSALVGVLSTVPLPGALRTSLRNQIVPALVEGLASTDAAHQVALCTVARSLYLRELFRDDPRMAGPLGRPLGGNATLVDAITQGLAPEVSFSAEVPGASEVLTPEYAQSVAEGLLELVRRVTYARGESEVALVLEDGRIALQVDRSREVAAWRRWLASN